VIYNVYFHPLRNFPGPILWAATPLPYVYYQITGRLPFIYQSLHDEHGDVVRVLPYKLSFRSPTAWKDIYQAGTGRKLLLKDAANLSPGEEGVFNIITAWNVKDHARYHRKLSPAFSQKALYEQESYIMHYVDLLITKLNIRCKESPQDMVKWLNLIFFDIIADLTFGESLHGLEKEMYHPWLDGLFGSLMKSITFARATRQFPHISKILQLFQSKDLAEQQVKHSVFVKNRVEQRVASNSTRRDFMSYILPYDQEKAQMSMAEVRATYGALMLAGSENVATTLVFTLYLLLCNPAELAKLTKEVRTTFRETADINFLAVSHMKYLGAVVNESMRIYPAAPTSQPRVVPVVGKFYSTLTRT
jgi:cytochrome P450